LLQYGWRIRAFIRLQMAGRKSLPTEIVQQLIAKADGGPLLVEELTLKLRCGRTEDVAKP
jgi:hypothetical protein